MSGSVAASRQSAADIIFNFLQLAAFCPKAATPLECFAGIVAASRQSAADIILNFFQLAAFCPKAAT
jgi:hypothetical protein